MIQPVSRRGFLRSAGLGALTAASAGALGTYSTRWLECNEYTFRLPRWTRKGFRVGFLSDTHLVDDNAVKVAREAVEYAIDAKPDVIVFGGDFVESSRGGSLGRMEDAFAPIRSCIIPCVAVLGNHDYAASHPERVVAKVRDLGFELLRNEHHDVDGVTVFGLDCMTFNRTDPAKLVELDARQDVLVVLHEPDGVDFVPDFASLMLAGHSHGGQICLPAGIPITTPSLARKFKKGYYADAPVPLFVSRGVGETGVRLRLFCRPEASILHLEPEGSA
ncbi:MAG TPA: metallophosphoesterase [Fimbriimonadaceae bacterium]|nr:metallophosphoesterase [Fimbriimonadaceae bacterium]